MSNTNRKIILSGGGDAEQSYMVDEFLTTLLPNKTFLFLPQAVSPELWSFKESWDWINIPSAFHELKITMCEDIKNINLKYLLEFDAIYLMGGNTYKLLKTIQESSLNTLLLDYLNHGKVLLGLSAGAIVMGNNISTAAIGPEKDENNVGLNNLNSLNFLNGNIVATHYVKEMDEELFEISSRYKSKIICIPETSGVFIENDSCYVIGHDPIVLIESSEKNYFKQGTYFNL